MGTVRGWRVERSALHFFRSVDVPPQLLEVAVDSGEIRIRTLDIDELIAIAKAGLSGAMTNEECRQYFRGPCP